MRFLGIGVKPQFNAAAQRRANQLARSQRVTQNKAVGQGKALPKPTRKGFRR